MPGTKKEVTGPLHGAGKSACRWIVLQTLAAGLCFLGIPSRRHPPVWAHAERRQKGRRLKVAVEAPPLVERMKLLTSGAVEDPVTARGVFPSQEFHGAPLPKSSDSLGGQCSAMNRTTPPRPLAAAPIPAPIATPCGQDEPRRAPPTPEDARERSGAPKAFL